MTLNQAIEICWSRNGYPYEDDWELAEAAKILADYFKLQKVLIISTNN